MVEKRIDSNELILAFDRLDTEGLYARRCRIGNISVTNKPMPTKAKIEAKPRYRAKAAPVAFEAIGEGSAMLKFDQPQRALTPGQICAFYDGIRRNLLISPNREDSEGARVRSLPIPIEAG